ncbi:MAG: M48 family metallopeptidase [Woeseiaceae bacterium]|nr:M48 family metallopeptidase [Woeseiaceae bacterium]
MLIERIKARLLLVATSVLLAACAAAPNQIDMEAEAARQFAEMRASIPLETDRETIDYIHCVAVAVVQELPPEYRDLNWDMAIFDSESVNAFAMPGGKIGVMTGILKAADNQDRLAAVIGHEIAHVTEDHAAERASRAKPSEIGVQVAAVLLGGGNQGATYTAYEALSAGAAFGLLLPFSRSQETEADVVGLKYMARAGFDPRESVPLWQNMSEQAGEAPAEFLSTHPSSEKRIDSLVSLFGETLALYNQAKAEGKNPNCGP